MKRFIKKSGPTESLAPEIPVDSDVYPVFVLGSPRSGTSTLAYYLNQHLGYGGGGEGHVYSLLYWMIKEANRHYSQFRGNDSGTTAAQLNPDRLADNLIQFTTQEITSVYGQRWFDKTPGAELIHCAPRIAALYPKARFIFMLRDPISTIDSRRRKFQGVPFLDHCQGWHSVTTYWLEAREKLPPQSFIEIPTSELSRAPRLVCQRILSLLGEHPIPADVRDRAILDALPQVEQTAPIAKPKILDEVDWSDDEKESFRQYCLAPMEAFGFLPNGYRQESVQETTDGGDASPTVGEERKRHDPVDLPAPYGQRELILEHGPDGGIWPERFEGATWIFMHPSASGPATKLTYDGLRLTWVKRIRSKVRVNSALSPTIRFTFTVANAETGENLSMVVIECPPGQERDVVLEVPKFKEACLLSVTSESVTGRIEYAWGLVKRLHLEPR